MSVPTGRRTGRPRALDNIPCATCGKVFRPANAKRKYCSMPCRNAARERTPESVWARVDVRGPRECWPARNHRAKSGYVNIEYPLYGRTWWAMHALCWALANGQDPGQDVRHLCHRFGYPPDRTCCNPHHLEPGTRSQDRQDRAEAIALGLSLPRRRTGGRRATIPEDVVLAVVQDRESGLSQDKIAKLRGLSQSHVSRILSGKSRSHA